MRLGIAAAPALLLLWQIAPVDAVRDSTGRTRLSIGFGTGQFEQRVYACALLNPLLSATPARYQTGGSQLDHWVNPRFRISAFGGRISSKYAEFAGGFGGLAAALEEGPVGIGAGISFAPIDSQVLAEPSVYLRLGSINRIHFRADLFNPEPAFGTTGILRFGLAGNQGFRHRGPRWFAGVGVPLDARGNKNGDAFAELSVPVSQQVDVTGSAALRDHEVHADWGVAVGARYYFNP
jgi:hypothetical protein